MSGLKNLHFYCAWQTFDLALQSVMDVAYPGGHSIVKNMVGGWLDSLESGILVGKDILGFYKNFDLDNS